MPKKAKIEIHATDDDLSAIDDELDAAVDGLVGVNQRIRDLLETIDPPEPEETPEGEAPATPVEGAGDAAAPNAGEEKGDSSPQESQEKSHEKAEVAKQGGE